MTLSRLKLALAVLALGGAACSGGPSPDTFGAELYDVSCARCHGGDYGGGIGPALDTDSDAYNVLTDDQLTDVIRVGPGAMPGFDRLSDEQITSLVELIRNQ